MKHTTRAGFVAVGLFVLGAVMGFSQAPPERQRMTYQVRPATGANVVDGVIDEAAWDDALHLELHYEVEPGENIEPPVRTEAFITHDEETVFVAFRCHDPDPESIRARYSDRDTLFKDDWIGIMFDTFNDQRRAFEFVVNPLGVQMDAINDDVGHHYDRSWDAIWDSAGRITDFGYECEIAVPFHQLRFQAVDGPQTWGIDVFRSYPRSDRHHIGLFPRERGANSYLAQEDKVEGFEGVEPGRNLELVPTVTWSETDEREEMPDGSLDTVSSDSEAGLTARWGVTPNITLSAAVNPDFSQVEADAVQLDLNQTFALFFPETRPFFLESADFFNSRLGLVHTRVLADPSIALKITAKDGPHTFALFSARDEETNVIIPGAEESQSATFEQDSTTSAGRYSFDFAESSSIGVSITDRRGGDFESSVLSVDGLFRLSPSDEIGAGIGWSATGYSEEMVDEFELEQSEVDGLGLTCYYRHSERNWNARVDYRDLDEGYREDAGFRPRVDYRVVLAGGEYIWWGEEDDFFRQMLVGGDFDYTEDQDGELLERESEAWFYFRAPLQSWLRAGVGHRTRVYDNVPFDQDFITLGSEIQPHGDLILAIFTSYSDWIDFEHTRPATWLTVRGSARLNLGKHLLFDLSHEYSWLDVDAGRLYTTNITQLRAVYQLNTRLFVRAVLQNVNVSRDPELYEDEVDAESRSLFSQLLFSYTLNPQSVIYLGYSDTNEANEHYGLTRANRTFFAKVSYAWLF